MFVTYQPQATGKQEYSGLTVSILEQITDTTFRVSSYTKAGKLVEWYADLNELDGFEGS
jgi:hypothetical protein